MGAIRNDSMKLLLREPVFWIGTLIRACLICFVVASPVTNWYLPFIDTSLQNLSFDPWGTWLAQDGIAIAFPYGYVMWVIFLPFHLLSSLVSLPGFMAYGVTLFFFDALLLNTLLAFTRTQKRRLLYVYWLSPIVIFTTYSWGYNDIIPVTLLTLSLKYLRQLKVALAALMLVFAISAKLSMVIALPFYGIYFLHNKSIRKLSPQFIQVVVLAMLVSIVPFMFSAGGVKMLLSNPEMEKVYSLAIFYGRDVKIFIVPIIYFLTVFFAYQVKRLNFWLFYTLLGTSFLALVLLTPAAPGWFMWTIPLLVIFQIGNTRLATPLILAFSVLFVVIHDFGLHQESWIGGMDLLVPVSNLTLSVIQHFIALLQTMLFAIGVVLMVKIYQVNINDNDYFRLSREPFALGIAGDSGAGKDTFGLALTGLFGKHSITILSGDDYHLWDRKKPIWQVMTHLNPMANDLEAFTLDLMKLIDGKPITIRHYDHQKGQKGTQFQIKSNDFLIATGLHALYSRTLRECYSLSIYLDIDEELRRYFKMNRDVIERGYPLEKVLESFQQREKDSIQFIRPQRNYADLILSIQPILLGKIKPETSKESLRYRLKVESRLGLNELTLVRVLVGVCGLHVDSVRNDDPSLTTFVIEGECSSEDIALAVAMISPKMIQFLDTYPHWESGVLGLMQLITIAQIDQLLSKRLLK
jgi:uridine kinase